MLFAEKCKKKIYKKTDKNLDLIFFLVYYLIIKKQSIINLFNFKGVELL